MSTAFEIAGFAVSARKAPEQIADAPLMKETEVAGKFWLPGRPSRKVAGTLRYLPGRDTSIVTTGSFFGSQYSNAQRRKAVVHGKLINGAPCSLLDAWIYENGYLSESARRDSLWLDISAKTLIVGAHIRSIEELKLGELTVQLSHLDQWIENPYTIERERGVSKVATVKFSDPELVLPFRVGEKNVDVKLECIHSLPFQIEPSAVSWQFGYQLSIRPKRAMAADLLLAAAASLRRFFTFLIGSSVYTLKLAGQKGNTRSRHNINLYPTVTVPNSIRINRRYFLGRYEKLKEILPDLAKSWSDNAERLDVVMRGIQELSTIDGIAPEGLFLAVTQLLEHFDGVIHSKSSNIVAPQKWKEFMRWLQHHWAKGELAELEAKVGVDPEHVKIFCQRIGEVNRISFRSRLERLFLEIPFHSLFRILNGPPPDHVTYVKELLRRVQKTRNYLTHLGGKRPKDAFHTEELQAVTVQCWCVLIYWTSKQLGMEEGLCREFASNARFALFLVSGSKDL